MHCISRGAAKAVGLTRYFTGTVCKHGHRAQRLVSTRGCVGCRRERDGTPKEKARQREKTLRYWWRVRGCVPTRPRPATCELCGGPPTSRALHLDHDPRSGAFRGWLCHYCNTSLGHFDDSVEGLERAIAYLRRAMDVAA